MSKISAKFGPIHGNDGNTAYRTINGTTYQNYIDTEAPKKERSKKQKTYAALIKLMNTYTYNHYADLSAFFPKGKNRSARHAFLAYNKGELAPAMYPLAERYANGEKISSQQIEDAMRSYAEANPHSIVVGIKQGYQPIYLSGAWPTKFSFILHDHAVTPAEYQLPDGSFVEQEGNSGVDTGDTNSGSGTGDSTPSNPTPTQVTISVVASPVAGGTVSGGGSYASGAQATLQAVANSGYRFVSWNDGNTSASRTITASASATYTATFETSGGGGGSYSGD